MDASLVDDIGRIERVVAIEKRECPERGGKLPMEPCYSRVRKLLMYVYNFVHPILAVHDFFPYLLTHFHLGDCPVAHLA